MATDSVRRLIELVRYPFDSTERKELAERALGEVEALEARVRRLEKGLEDRNMALLEALCRAEDAERKIEAGAGALEALAKDLRGDE